MITVSELTKRFGHTLAVDHLSFTVRPGRVTGFLGPNGSGKSTSMRCMLGLDRPEHGGALFDGTPYHLLERPLHQVGSLLDAGYVHPGRSGRNHLRWLAAASSVPRARVDQVLELVGLASVGGRRVKGYSLGMRQRLGLAGVLLGDPHTVILDEPANGLDPEGIRWIRDVLVRLADQGKTVLVSSHLLSEMALMATELVVIGAGRLIEQCSVAEFVGRYADTCVLVRSPSAPQLGEQLRAGGAHVRHLDATSIEVRGANIVDIGELAARHGVVLHELSPQTGSLEDAFLQATATAQEYRSGSIAPPAATERGMPLPPPSPGSEVRA
jgi:ABC-2 type transport system ATP-binding protein